MLGVSVTINDNEVIVSPQDRVDVRNSKELQEECLKVVDKADTFILDLEKVSYITSAGLRVIVVLQQLQNEHNRKLIIRKPGEVVMKILDDVGFLDFLTVD